VDFPFDGFKFGDYCANPAFKDTTYELYAVSNHMGGMGGGHYTAYAKNAVDQNWWVKCSITSLPLQLITITTHYHYNSLPLQLCAALPLYTLTCVRGNCVHTCTFAYEHMCVCCSPIYFYVPHICSYIRLYTLIHPLIPTICTLYIPTMYPLYTLIYSPMYHPYVAPLYTRCCYAQVPLWRLPCVSCYWSSDQEQIRLCALLQVHSCSCSCICTHVHMYTCICSCSFVWYSDHCIILFQHLTCLHAVARGCKHML
jgi:hypothetical protein